MPSHGRIMCLMSPYETTTQAYPGSIHKKTRRTVHGKASIQVFSKYSIQVMKNRFTSRILAASNGQVIGMYSSSEYLWLEIALEKKKVRGAGKKITPSIYNIYKDSQIFLKI